MKITAIALLCAVTALMISACTQSAPTNSAAPVVAASPRTPIATATATPAELATARANYAKNCESCHGETGEGGLVKVNNKRLKVPSLKAEHAKKHSDEQLVKQVTNGGDGMPPFKDKLKPEDVQELVKFVRKEFQGQ